MAFILIFVSIIILCLIEKIETGDNNITNINNKLNNSYLKAQNTTNTKNKRKLVEARDINILIDVTQLKSDIKGMGKNEEIANINAAIEKAIETIRGLIKIKTEESSINILDYINELDENYFDEKEVMINIYQSQPNVNYDLIIFVRGPATLDNTMTSFAEIIKIKKDGYGRVIYGQLIYKYDYDYFRSSTTTMDNAHRQHLLTVLFIHEIIHFLGFDNEILLSKGFIVKRSALESRIKSGSTFEKYVVTNQEVLNYAKDYYGCSEVPYIEFSRENAKEDLPNSHWEGRLLLGDIMTLDLYYPEQIISEFTLILLEQLGWYEIKRFTGGLMKFGRGQGCSFISKDCISLDDKIVSFPNEFCAQSFGTCSFGRQSRSFCNNIVEITSGSDISNYKRNENFYKNKYGLEMVEYCPVSVPINDEDYRNYYYIGSCNIGNGNYGYSLEFFDNRNNHKYDDFNNAFKEEYGDKSFCALSSLLKNDNDNSAYKGLIRPTCYAMSCSEKSLTIQIDTEYIVCPRYGGLVEIDGEYTDFKGYLFCPDYNLICSGKELYNNLFDCIDKGIESKKISRNDDYYKHNINYTSEVKTNNENEIKKYYSPSQEGYELSEDGKCPLDCMQCLSNKRCILCGNSKNIYIGEKNDETSHINCTNIEPENGYYRKVINGHTHYFRCVEGCEQCTDAVSCSKCYPQFYLSGDKTKCIERIPHCKTYNTNSINITDGGYDLCDECDNENNYYCIDFDRKHCTEVTNRDTYFSLEPNKKYPCISECGIKFPNCIKCNINTCNYCDPKFYFNTTHHCIERIPNCETYDEDSKRPDHQTNGGGEGYFECDKCDTNYACFLENRAKCDLIDRPSTAYYDYGNGCLDTCENAYTFVCLECIKEKCTKCQTRHKSDEVHCVNGIRNCSIYDQDPTHGNDTYIECLRCDEANNFICIKQNRTFCKQVEKKESYYKLDTSYEYSCYNKCDDKFKGCDTCNQDRCLSCKNKYEFDSQNVCHLIFVPMPDDYCKVITKEINDNIDQIDFEKLIDYYIDNIYSYLNTVIHYVNKYYTMAMFINSDCTELLLEQGYYKIDSKQLSNKITEEVGLEFIRNEFLFHFFIQYNNTNHYRAHDSNSKYIEPKSLSAECVDIPFTLTIKYNNTISLVLGPIVSSAIVLEKLDIFSKDSEVFTDICQNITLEGVDIPLNDRLHYLYFGDFSTQMACGGGDNCELVEINKEESSSVCKCKLNEKNDLFKEIIIEKTERPEIKSSSSDSFGIIKCTKNGFHANNVKSNGGFYICLIVIVAVGVLILCYFLCSKIITTSEKGLNPPSKIKNRLRIVSNWDKTEEERKKMKKFNEEVMNDFQPRDEHEDELYEEEKDYSYIYYDMSNSFDTALFEKKLNNRGRGDKTRKILVLLPGTKKNQNEEDNFSSSESSPLDGPSKKKKKTFCQIYWHVLSLKQHIINFFSFCTCINITESYIPLPIRIIRSLFLVVLSFLLCILFLDQKYYSKKFKYFNEKYKLIAGTTDGVTITPEEVVGGVPSGELWSYSFSHTFVNGLIVFIILLVAQFIIGVAFFSLRNKVIEVLKKNDTSGINELVSQTRIKYLVFFIIVVVLLVLFLFVFIAFGGAYGGGFSDYFLPGIVALIFLEIFPFLWSLIISLLYYLGIKQKSKCCRQTSRFFMF